MAGGVSVALNAMGWDADNLAAETLNALLGTEFWTTEAPLAVHAYVRDADVDAAGDLTVSAESAAQLNSTVSNAASSTAASLYGATGTAASGILSSNRVSSEARAFIEHTGADRGSVTADGALTLTAQDTAGIHANSKVVSSSITTSDGGVAVLQSGINQLLPADFDTTQGVQDIAFGTRVRLAADYLDADFTSDEIFPQDLTLGTQVKLADDFDDTRGNPGRVYTFVQATPDSSVDLRAQDYTDTTRWRELGGKAGGVYEYMGTAASGTDLDLGRQNYDDLGFWKPVAETQLVPQGNSLSGSDSVAIGGLVAVNDVRSRVDAFVDHAIVEVDALDIGAFAQATIDAIADSTAKSSGGSAFGTGQSLGVNATIATNVVLSAADAYVSDSAVITVSGDLTLTARNDSLIDATTSSAATSGANSVGILIAFNTVGWEAQNLLFNGLDALIGLSDTEFDFTTADSPDALESGERVQLPTGGTYRYLGAALTGPMDLSEDAQNYTTDTVRWSEVTPVFGNERPARVQAYLLNTTVDAAGGVTLDAASTAQINALVTNAATSAPTAFFGA